MITEQRQRILDNAEKESSDAKWKLIEIRKNPNMKHLIAAFTLQYDEARTRLLNIRKMFNV